MWRMILIRLGLSIPLVVIVTSLTFVMIDLLPGNAAEALIGLGAKPEDLQQLTTELGLDRPLWAQWWIWMSGVLHGDLGHSLTTKEAVASALGYRVGVTLSLAFGTLIFAVAVGVTLGVLTARGSGRSARGVDLLATVGYSIPPFWLAIVLIFFFSVKLGWLPAVGYTAPTVSLGKWAMSLVLPVLALSMHLITALAKQTRDAMRDTLASSYILALRANGMSERSIIFKHALRNAAIPIVTVIGVLFIGLLTGTVIIESVFAMPGLGATAVYATSVGDIPMIQGVALYLTLAVVVVNILTDLAYGWLNPKVRTR